MQSQFHELIEKPRYKAKLAETLADMKECLEAIDMSEEEMLLQIRQERQNSINFVQQKRQELFDDLSLLYNVKTKKERIGDTTLFNVHTAMLARSYSDKVQAKLLGDNFTASVVSTFNQVLEEDMSSDEIAALKYRKDWDKLWAGVGIIAKVGWDGVRKRGKFTNVNPLTWVPQMNGDYATGNYDYCGFDKVMTATSMAQAGYANLEQVGNTWEAQGAKNERMQEHSLLKLTDTPERQDDDYEVYAHFGTFNGVKAFVVTTNNQSVVLLARLIKPLTREEKKNPEAIPFPLAFYYWKPQRDNPFGDRPANYTRDVQIVKSEIANLRIDKMRAELYPMYFYNSDLIKGADLNYAKNKHIPVSTGPAGAVPLDSLVRPIQRDTRIDTSLTIDQTLDVQVEKSTSIGAVVQGTTTERSETLGTNQLVQSNTDINLSLNTKINNWGETQFVRMNIRAYMEHFSGGDRKTIEIKSGPTTIPRQISAEDFITNYEPRIRILSTGTIREEKERRLNRYVQLAPFVLGEQSIHPVEKKYLLRKIYDEADIPSEDIASFIAKTPAELEQEIENVLLMNGQFVGVKDTDDDLAHLIALQGAGDTEEAIIHRMLHIKQYIAKGGKASDVKSADAGGMLGGLIAQSGAQTTSQLSQPVGASQV